VAGGVAALGEITADLAERFGGTVINSTGNGIADVTQPRARYVSDEAGALSSAT
jgi:hypothetical protein